ncbi:radical SAM protein [bacterium]|nr:MAG: radical SAM protein [bacterium]
MSYGLPYADRRGRIFFDEQARALADDGTLREPRREELIPLPAGSVVTMLPERAPLVGAVTHPRPYGKGGYAAVGVLLPSGYTRLLLPAYRAAAAAPALPLFGYTFACVVDDELHVAAAKTDEGETWKPRFFEGDELETAIERRIEIDPQNSVLGQVALCSREYGCFTAQNVFFECGEAAIPVSPACNARCLGCISEQQPDSPFPSSQTRISRAADVEEIVRVALHHLAKDPGGIVSFGQGCEGEPLMRYRTIVAAIRGIRAHTAAGTLNLNTNGSLPEKLQETIDAGLQAVRVSLNSFRPDVYAAYYRPDRYGLDDVLDSIRRACAAGLRVSLNLLTFPGVSDEDAELDAMECFLREVRVEMVQTRTLNIDPAVYRQAVGPAVAPRGMLEALARIRAVGSLVGNFTHDII